VNDEPEDTWTPAPAPVPPEQTASPRRGLLRRRSAAVATATGLAVGGMVGGYIISNAASNASSPSPAASPGSATTNPLGHPGGFRGPGGDAARTQDEQDIATAIGISVSQLQSELSSGKTIAQVATAHGVAVSKVIDALVVAENKEVDAALAAGSITQGQADQLKAQQKQRITDLVNGTGRGFGGPHGGPGGAQGEDAQVVATAIGITVTQLQTDLSGGKTIAQVATAHNVAVSTVISAWAASENQEIDARVASGQLTQAQADQMKSMTQQRITDVVNGTFSRGPWGGPGGRAPAGSSSGSGTPATDASA